MNNILEDLFFGELDVNTQDDNTSKSMQNLDDIENTLMNSLKKEDKQFFIKYVNLCSQINAETAVSKFKTGFKVGLKLIIDTYRDDI